MKHLTIIILAIISITCASAQTSSYASSSALASGNFVKVRIKDSGVYKLTYDDLKSMGVTPENVRVFGYGGAVINQDFTKPSPDDLPEVRRSGMRGTR